MTIHAVEEMAEDGFDIIDVEHSIGNGRVVKSEKRDPRGTRHSIRGPATDTTAYVETVGRFTETGRYLIITAYKITEP